MKDNNNSNNSIKDKIKIKIQKRNSYFKESIKTYNSEKINEIQGQKSKNDRKRKILKTDIFPIINIKNKTINSNKFVKDYNRTERSIPSKTSLTLKLKQNDSLSSKKDSKTKLNLNAEEEHSNLGNNDSSYLANNLNQNTPKKTNKKSIFSYCSKNEMYNFKNKNSPKNGGDSESLKEVFNKLLNVKHKIKELKDKRNKKRLRLLTEINHPLYKNKKNLSYSQRKINTKLNNQNKNNLTNYVNNTTSNNILNLKSSLIHQKKTTSKNFTKVNFQSNNKQTKTLKPNINLINFRRSASIYKKFNEHIKYIEHIRQSEIVSLAKQYKRALYQNEKEKDFHYKNCVFPLDIIERIIKIKEHLTLNKYRNEYLKRLDRYNVHLISKFMENEKKIINKSKAEFFKGLFFLKQKPQ